MNNKMEVFNIGGVECYEKDGVVYLKLETVARGLGFTQTAKSGNEVVRWERVHRYLVDLGVPTCGDDGFIPENIFYRLAMKAKNAVAEAFQAKVADEIIPSVRKHGSEMNNSHNTEIITVNYNNDQPTVSARELHGFLEVETRFNDWFRRMCEYGFTENRDFRFYSILSKTNGGRPAQDAEITIEMAKEICMLQRNEKGKQARQYFIELERAWNSPEKVMARALLIAQKAIEEKDAQIEQQAQKIEADAPKVLFADSVAASKSSILVYDLAKMMRQNSIDIGGRRLFAWMRDNGYLVRRQGKDYNMPTQRSMEMGLFEIKETVITHSDGHISTSRTPLVSGKGQVYFLTKFLEARLPEAR